MLGDTYADYDKFYDAASSVDGTSDTWDAGALRRHRHRHRLGISQRKCGNQWWSYDTPATIRAGIG